MSQPLNPSAEQYRRQAEEAEAMAAKCKDPQAAESFRTVARQWRELAKRAEGRASGR